MNRIARALALGVTLALAVGLLTGDGQAYYVSDDMKKDLDDLVAAIKGDDAAKVKKLTGAMKQKNDDLNEWMGIYKPTKSKGIGYDPDKKGPGDGIEKRIIDLASKKALPDTQLKKEQDLILRTAYYNLAMYHLTKEFSPKKPKGGKGEKEWNTHNEEVKHGSEAVIKAVKAGDPAALKKAMGTISSGCNECHTDFR